MMNNIGSLLDQSLWERSELFRKCSESIDTYLSKCMESEDVESIITYPEIFAAACCRQYDLDYMQLLFTEKLQELLADIEKVRDAFFEGFYSRENFKICLIYHPKTPEKRYLIKQKNEMPFKMHHDQTNVIHDHEKFVLLMEKISIICGANFLGTSYIDTNTNKCKIANIFEFEWKPIKYSEAVKETPPLHEYSNFLQKIKVFGRVLSSDKIALNIHSILLPQDVKLNKHCQILNFNKYTTETLNVFFSALYLTPDQFRSKYSERDIDYLELLAVAQEHGHEDLKKICASMLNDKATAQDTREILKTRDVYQDNNRCPPHDKFADAEIYQGGICYSIQ